MVRWIGNVFLTQFIGLVFFQLLAAWLWHVFGYTWEVGLVLFVIEGILLPIGIGWFMYWKAPSSYVLSVRRTMVYWGLSLLFLVSSMVGVYICMFFSGYQSIYHDWGAGVAQVEAVWQWIIASFVLRQAMRYFELHSYKQNS